MKRNMVIGAAVAAVIVVVALVLILVPLGGGPSNQEAQKKAEMLFASMKAQGGTVTYKTVTPDGNGLVIKGLTMDPPAKATGGKKRTITVDELHIRDLDWKNQKQPQFADIEFKGARVSGLDADPKFKQFAAATGVNDLVIGGHVKYRVDPAKKQIVVEPFHLTIDKIGAFTLSISLDGLDVKQLQGLSKGGNVQPAQLMGLAGQIQLRSLSIKIKNDGGFERMLKAEAAKQNKSADDLKKMALAQINGLAASPMGKSKLVTEALTAAKTFINNPGTITLEAKPSAPVAVFPVVMGAMAGGPKPENIDRIKTQLGVTITAE